MGWMWLSAVPAGYAMGAAVKGVGTGRSKYGSGDFGGVRGLHLGGTVEDMTVAPNGDIWTVNDQYWADSAYTGGLHRFRGSTSWTSYILGGVPNRRSEGIAASIVCDNSGVVWIGHQLGGDRAIEWF